MTTTFTEKNTVLLGPFEVLQAVLLKKHSAMQSA